MEFCWQGPLDVTRVHFVQSTIFTIKQERTSLAEPAPVGRYYGRQLVMSEGLFDPLLKEYNQG